MKESPTDNALPRLIYQTSLRLQLHADKVLQSFGITLEQLQPLKLLSQKGGAIGQRQLCVLAGKTPANMTRILDRLAVKSLVQRQPDPDDRRAVKVVLTLEGEKLLDLAVNLFAGYLDKVMAGVSAQDETVCRRVLEKITLNLAELEPEGVHKDPQA